ncbi:hypothetical protein [Janthinobacterium sp. PSPC3-1]|uniref:hypothetical protein n=1 Tax=Janthinobacterium sp. PSPC3-1 TaxID=2804653 RepID=UPI003CE68AA9
MSKVSLLTGQMGKTAMMNIGMKNKIYGRKVGSSDDMVMLCESDGGSNSNSAKRADPGVVAEFVIANARRFVKALRERNVEGYIVFEGDLTHYTFTPEADFVYPASVH